MHFIIKQNIVKENKENMDKMDNTYLSHLRTGSNPPDIYQFRIDTGKTRKGHIID